MQAIIPLPIIAGILCVMLCRQDGQTCELSDGTYAIYQNSAGICAAITFDLEEDTFMFIYNPVLSYLPHGTVRIENEIATAATDDEKTTLSLRSRTMIPSSLFKRVLPKSMYVKT